MQPASATRPTRPLVLVALFGLLGAGGPPGATWADEGNPRIDYRRFKAEVAEVETLRESRRVDEDAFLEMAADPQTVILDARSREKYDLVHVRGARHLSFPDISADELSKVIPTKDTRVLIYCNNNFEGEPVGFFPKLRSAALNVHTFTTLHAYGYTNVYELKPLLDVRTTKIPFAGRGVDDRGRASPR
jgi:3-mercaptopyruvate sulfurtransferase SseA